MCACAISAECVARHGHFEIAKQAELTPQHKKKSNIYQRKNWTSMLRFLACSKNCVVPP